jgi:hypothetical protein
MTETTTTRTDGSAAAVECAAQLDGVGARLAPGTEGWWQVWGARAPHVRPGDVIATAGPDGAELSWIADTFTAKAAPMRCGFVDLHGVRYTFGALAPLVVLRRGTHHTLAD